MNNAQMYITSNPMQKKDAKEALDELRQTFAWSEKEKVLDVGSGPGDVTVEILAKFAPQDAKIIGSDITKEMVNYGNSQYKSSGVEFRQLDIQGENIKEEWDKESFDKIFSFYCLHWVKNQRQAAKNMYSLLKHGGEVFLLFLSQNPVFELYLEMSKDIEWSAFMTDAEKYISPYHRSSNPASDFARVLQSANFSNIKVYNKKTSFIYTSKESIINSICAVNPFLEKIPPELRGDYNKSIGNAIDELRLAEKLDDGTFEVKYSLIIARAKKL